jgi:hypothetical protein
MQDALQLLTAAVLGDLPADARVLSVGTEVTMTIRVTRVGLTSMREPLSRPEQDEHGTSQTSIRHHPQLRSAM